MKIYLVRHGIAVDPGAPGYEDDSLRPLAEEGSSKMKKIAAALKGLNVKPDLIVASPYVRARQTAEILAKVLKYKRELIFNEVLVPMGNADNIIGTINEKYSVDELMLVGHEPCLSSLISMLVTGSPKSVFDIKKGGVGCLSVDSLHIDRKVVLEWLLTPKILTSLA